MPQVKFAPAALRDLEQLREFLRPKNPAAAKRAAAVITKAVKVLGQHPQIGRPVEETDVDVDDTEGHTYRELPIGFGDSGYVMLYRHDGELVTVLALRHQKEVSF
ncbi:MAG: type II toxin-antitoxin system RelE/ParE family toxin [Gammaproteobacteria bacterium]|nr:type II toxin-antitoxin system RelE/ParE family toxin [Gammaproteobacteria bacterium]